MRKTSSSSGLTRTRSPQSADGERFLIDATFPRGLKKERLQCQVPIGGGTGGAECVNGSGLAQALGVQRQGWAPPLPPTAPAHRHCRRSGAARLLPAPRCASGLAPRASTLRSTSGATLQSSMQTVSRGVRLWRRRGGARCGFGWGEGKACQPATFLAPALPGASATAHMRSQPPGRQLPCRPVPPRAAPPACR